MSRPPGMRIHSDGSTTLGPFVDDNSQFASIALPDYWEMAPQAVADLGFLLNQLSRIV
jgi:hypothetical protein